jgi:hypothetical protein
MPYRLGKNYPQVAKPALTGAKGAEAIFLTFPSFS